MKKILVCILALGLMLGLAGCKNREAVYLPPHVTLGKTASLEGADDITGAYILASDTAINLCADKLYKDSDKRPEYISFDFATNFALNKQGREKLVSAFEVYGIELDTKGVGAHQGLAEQNRGFVLQYIIGGQHNSADSDLTITVEVLVGNKGYAYYFDFNIFGDEYVMINYEDAYEKMR